MTHIPGHVATTTDTATTTDGGFNLTAGMLLQDQSGIIWRIVQRGDPATVPLSAESVNATSSAGTPLRTNLFNLVQQAGRFFLTETGRAIELTAPNRMTFSARQLTAGESGTLFPTGGGAGGLGGGGSAPAFSSTQASQAQAEAFAAAEAEKNRRFQAEQNAIAAEAAKRENRLAALRDLIAEKIRAGTQAKGELTNIAGVDPLRFIARFRGMQLAPGTKTPFDIFKGELGTAARFKEPEISPTATTADLESAIAKLSGVTPPTPGIGGALFGLSSSPETGFAHGGTIFAGGRPVGQAGGVGFSVLVGEKGGFTGDEEVLNFDESGRLEDVRPLAGGAQEGFDPRAFTGFAGLFRGLRESLGVPRGTLGLSTGAGLPASVRGLFGILPRGTPSRTSIGGTPPAFSGVQSGLFATRGLQQALESELPPAQAAAEARRLSRLIGLLPEPFKVPRSFFDALAPQEKTALLSAYRLSGYTDDDFRHLMQAATLTGGATAALPTVGA